MTNICDGQVHPRLLAPVHSRAHPVESGDGRLLDRFIQRHDESAFAEIVRRHGAMVLGVCQRVLDNRHDAEDCFQAVFMVLVRKAATIQPRDMVGNWLYGVAYRTALEARKLAARRRNHEKKKHAMPKPEATNELWTELRPVLDQELSRLPDKYRVVVVACDLEGKTRSEVADLLHLPEGTVASRLARARAMLAKRLQRHRLIVTPGFLAMLLAEEATSLELPETLVASASRLAHSSNGSARAASLAEAVVHAMFWTKIKVAAAVVCVIALLGLGVASFMPSADAHVKKIPLKVPLEHRIEKPSRYILRKVDSETQEVQVFKIDGKDPVSEMKLKPGAKVLIGGKEKKLADLHIGMIVSMIVHQLGDGRQEAQQIEMVGHAVSAQIQTVEADKVTIKSDEPGLVADAITLDPQVSVTIDGKASKLDAVKKDMSVTVQVTAEAGRERVVAIICPPLGKR